MNITHDRPHRGRAARRLLVTGLVGALSTAALASVPAQAAGSGRPGAVPSVSLITDPPNGDGSGHLAVRWSRPTSGGAPTTYLVQVLSDGRGVVMTKRVTAPTRTTDFTVPNGRRYFVRITPSNRSGAASRWTASPRVTVFDRSSAPTALRATGDGDRTGELTFTTPKDNGGYPVTHYRVETQDGTSVTTTAPTKVEGTSTRLTIPFASNHEDPQWVRITPLTYPTRESEQVGAGGQISGFRPFGKPGAPGANGTSSGYNEVTLRWTGGTPNGRPIERTEYRGAASGTASGGGGEVTLKTSSGGEQRCVQVRAYAGGLWSDWSSEICGTALQRAVSVTVRDYPGNAPGPCNENCDAVHVDLQGFDSNANVGYTTNFEATDGSGPIHGSIAVDSSGRGSRDVLYYNRSLYDDTYCVTVTGYSQVCVRGR